MILLANLVRRRRPAQLLDRVGWIEVLLFVAVPSLLYGLAQAGVALGQLPAGGVLDIVLLNSVVAAILQLIVLFLVWMLVGSGLVALVSWLTSELLGSLGSAGVALARTVPLLLGVVTFFTFTTEIWQTAGRVTTVPYTATILLFVVVSGLFLSSRWQLDIDWLATFATQEELDAALHCFPGSARPSSFPATCELSRRQSVNLRFVAALSKLVVASLVASLVFVFFLTFEFLAIDAAAVKSWVTTEPKLIFTWQVATHTFAMTWEHVKVAGFLAVFTGFYFSIVSVTDAGLREGLRDTAEDAVRDACAARLAVTSGAGSGAAASSSAP